MMRTVETAARTIASECACLHARKAARSLTRLYDEQLRPLSIETSQLSVLVAVAHFGDAGVRSGVLAESLGLERTTLTRNLGPLETAGLLRISRSSSDARVRVVALTRAGEQMIEKAFPLWQNAQQRVRDLAGKARVERIRDELKEVAQLVGGGPRDDEDESPRRRR